jgi:hypothetical protein
LSIKVKGSGLTIGVFLLFGENDGPPAPSFCAAFFRFGNGPELNSHGRRESLSGGWTFVARKLVLEAAVLAEIAVLASLPQ